MNGRPSPVEVWLTKRNIAVTCMVVREDESTEELDVDSLSMRGAQREITGRLAGMGYSPSGRWTASDRGSMEARRAFRLTRAAAEDVGGSP